MNDHETRKAFTVGRLMQLDFFKVDSPRKLGSISYGEELIHDGYAAGTTNVGGVPAGGGTRIATRILVTPGSRGVYLEPFTRHPGEHEVLLARGRKFIFEGLGKLPDGSPLVYLRMV